MRLIDADALKINCDIIVGDTTIGRRDYVTFHEIDSAPTIDAVSVVRCKDCRWSEPNEFGDLDCRCHIPTFRVNADGFCSYGAHMKGAKNDTH